MRTSRTERPGLQVERTVLAWDRTTLALLANGALLFARHLRGAGGVALLPAVLALVAALLVAVLGRRRARRLRRRPATPPGDRVALTVAGAAVVVVGMGVLAALVPGVLADRLG